MDVDSVLNNLKAKARDVLKQAPYMMQAYIGTNMTRTSAASAARGLGPNRTTRLRLVTGNLFQSFAPNNPNNVTEFSESGDVVTMAYGSKVVYAAIHEYGGTIRHPGSNKWQVFRIGNKTIYTSYTKPHNITIPKRPYLAPAVEKMKSEGYDILIRKIKYEVLKELM